MASDFVNELPLSVYYYADPPTHSVCISNNNKSNKAQIMFNYKDRYFGDFRLYFEQTFRSAKIYRITTRLFN